VVMNPVYILEADWKKSFEIIDQIINGITAFLFSG